MRGSEICPKILIRSDTAAEDINVEEDDIIIVDQNHFFEETTFCLEAPIYGFLNTWIEGIKTVEPTKQSLWVIEEIKTILEEMSLTENSTRCESTGIAHIVPEDVKGYLFG